MQMKDSENMGENSRVQAQTPYDESMRLPLSYLTCDLIGRVALVYLDNTTKLYQTEQRVKYMSKQNRG